MDRAASEKASSTEELMDAVKTNLWPEEMDQSHGSFTEAASNQDSFFKAVVLQGGSVGCHGRLF